MIRPGRDHSDPENKPDASGLSSVRESYRFADLFRNVFKKHSSEEVESLFATGSRSSGPRGAFPHPWFYSRILILVQLLYSGFYIGLIFFENINFLPGLIMLGAFLTPLSLLFFFWEINVLSNISLYRVTLFFLIGGLVSLLYSVMFYTLVDGYSIPLFIGIIEETAKLTAVLIFIRKRNYTGVLNGLLIGAAVGAGFASFETSGYILMTALKYGVSLMMSTIFWRAILAPGGHIAWAALTGAAVMMVKESGKFRLSRLFHYRFLWIFILVILLHILWDTDIPQPLLPDFPIYPVLLTVISWVILFRMIRKGIYEVSSQTPCAKP